MALSVIDMGIVPFYVFRDNIYFEIRLNCLIRILEMGVLTVFQRAGGASFYSVCLPAYRAWARIQKATHPAI